MKKLFLSIFLFWFGQVNAQCVKLYVKEHLEGSPICNLSEGDYIEICEDDNEINGCPRSLYIYDKGSTTSSLTYKLSLDKGWSTHYMTLMVTPSTKRFGFILQGQTASYSYYTEAEMTEIWARQAETERIAKQKLAESQVWTSKNLDVSTYRNGDTIPQVQDQNAWAALTTGAWCYYDNDTTNGTKYGKLYNWYAVNDPRGLAPVGYHLPTDAEWTILTDYLGGELAAGPKMISTSGWSNKSNGTNSSGFTGLPGGLRYHDGRFIQIGLLGFWWSSTKYNTDDARYRLLVYSDTGGAGSNWENKACGFSVRILKD